MEKSVTARTLVERDVPIPMPDGVILRADVWRPADGEPRPALLQRTPYDKADSYVTAFHSALEPLRATAAGYVVVVQDVRGRFASDGDFEPFIDEATDGRATIEWLRAQPYCDGRVALYGVSYLGATQLLAAASSPEGLFALALHETAVDYFDGWTHQGGAFQLGFSIMWALALADADLTRRAEAGADVTAPRAALDPFIAEPEQAFAITPPTAFAELVAALPSYERWLREPPSSAYWRSITVRDRLESLDIPTLHIGGWYDVFLSGTLATFALMSARAPQRLVVGPWAHAVPLQWIGALDYGPAAGQPALDMTSLHLRFFDAALAGTISDDLPDPARVFVMGANEWRSFGDWPPPEAEYQRWYLHPAGSLGTEAPDSDAPPSRFVYDPNDPVPTCGGPTFLPGLFVGSNAGPRDQRAIEQRDDVLVFTSEELEHPLEVIGPIVVDLYAASTAPDTDWTAKLVDVWPDGTAYNVADGILRARFRRGLDSPEPLVAEQVYRFAIDLVATAQRFDRRHRLRVEISSSNFPRFDRNSNTGGEIATEMQSHYRIARQTVFHDRERASAIVLPVVAGTAV